MSANSEGGVSAPVRQIHDAQRECLEAREIYQQAKQEGADVRTAAHRELHRAVKHYYEAMFPLLDKRAVEDFWDGSEDYYLWTRQRQVIHLQPYLQQFDPKQLAENDIEIEDCPEWAYLDDLPEWVIVDEVASEFVELDVEYVGLRGLEFGVDEVRIETRTYEDATGTHEETVEEFRPLEADVLIEASRLLDKAAQRLGILAEVDDDVPTTTVTMETVEDFRENLKDVLDDIDSGKYGDGIEDLPGEA